jgi:hypothetical protein
MVDLPSIIVLYRFIWTPHERALRVDYRTGVGRRQSSAAHFDEPTDFSPLDPVTLPYLRDASSESGARLRIMPVKSRINFPSSLSFAALI